MLTIKVGKNKIKVFNLLILVFSFILILYIMFNLFFMLPCFKKTYSYKMDNGNYEVSSDVKFKTKWFSTYIIEKNKYTIKDKNIEKKLNEDLINDGYKKTNKNEYKRKTKVKGFSKKTKNNYVKSHNVKNNSLKLNGNYNETILFGEVFNDLYVEAVKNGKATKDVIINSNLNKNKLGTYVISYNLKIDDIYTIRLYRSVKIIDNEPPVITLNGENMVLNYGAKYVEPGFSATDNYDGDVTSIVKIDNKINTKKPGVYKIIYSVKDSSGNKVNTSRDVTINEEEKKVIKSDPMIEQKDGLTYVNGVLIVNKKYGLPKDYNPGVNKEALNALKKMQADASALGLDLKLVSGYRTYERQEKIYNKYVKKDGQKKADTYSSRPGHSEHQTGLTFDIGEISDNFSKTNSYKWLENNAHLYGFIIRYPKGKEDITGYKYEPWHVRYLGVDLATKVKESGLCLEEYLKIN